MRYKYFIILLNLIIYSLVNKMCPNSNNQNDNNIINRQNKTTTALKSQTSLSTQKSTNIPKNVMKKSFIERISKLANNPYVKGMGSITNIFGSSISYKPKSLKDDLKVLRNDWEVIGTDMQIAFDLFRKEVPNGR